MKIKHYRKVVAAAALIFCIALGTVDTEAQTTRLGIGDRVELSVPQRQELNRQLVISDNGSVYIPIIGDVVVEGMMLDEAQDLILRRLREVYPSVTSVQLILLGRESRRMIYVHGEVLTPGKYEFRDDPNVWEAVREAGGVTAEGSLDAVRIIRAETEGRRTFIVNLQQVIENGDFESLPELRPGDTVIVPARSVQYSGSGSVRVIGSVVTPGPYKLHGNKTLTDAVLAAGGPDDNANLKNVRIIRHLPEGTVVTIEVDFEKYLTDGDIRQNPAILPNDTVSVPRERNVLRVLFGDPRFLLGTLTASAALIAVIY